MMLAVHPELVGEPAAAFERPSDALLMLADLGASGVIGDATAAREQAGREFLDLVAAALVRHVQSVFPAKEEDR